MNVFRIIREFENLQVEIRLIDMRQTVWIIFSKHFSPLSKTFAVDYAVPIAMFDDEDTTRWLLSRANSEIDEEFYNAQYGAMVDGGVDDEA